MPDLKVNNRIQPEPEKVKDPGIKDEPVKSSYVKNTKSKFEVFRPKKVYRREHNPKTIISSFPKEHGKNK